MPPTVILIRHGEALHNAMNKFQSSTKMLFVKSNILLQSQQMLLTSPDSSYRQIRDPPLTPLGTSQCEALRTHLQSFDLAQKVEFIVVSPMRRALQTMELSLD
jgi:broad specificity phosphatase PhoE